MTPVVLALIVVAVVVVVVVLMVIGIYNRLVGLGVAFKNAFAQIDVQLKRRYDLIPNLVEVAKGYMAHERTTLEAVISARNAASAGLKAAAANPGDATALASLSAAENQLTGTLGRLFALSEAYPDLKANANMMQVSEELSATENKVAFARQAYNDSAMRFNAYRRSFPPIVVAGMFGYGQDAVQLEFADKAQIQNAPVVKF
ncbi:MAG: LemA family protein [Phycisphaerales bacterium]|nr:LemA family protein [Phycisphaerales bacterium]